MTTLGAGIGALAFFESNSTFSKSSRSDAEAERKSYDLAEEKLQKDKNKRNEDKMKILGFINNRMHQRNEEISYISNVNEAIVELYRVFVHQIKPLPLKPQ